MKLMSLIRLKVALGTAVILCVACPCPAAELGLFPGARYIAGSFNDGDSFRVRFNNKEQTVRLYYVDCPETFVETEAAVRRVREQMRYFGLPSLADTTRFGKEAAAFVEARLAEPFTLFTSFASAPGRTAGGRIYGFVTTSTGNDLASLLISAGYARRRGLGRETPGGVSRKETIARLSDLELSAALRHAGIWSLADANRIVALRAEQRHEETEFNALRAELLNARRLKGPLDLNRAAKEELQMISGIGPALAERIIRARPFKSADDLLRVSGIGPKTLESFKKHIVVRK